MKRSIILFLLLIPIIGSSQEWFCNRDKQELIAYRQEYLDKLLESLWIKSLDEQCNHKSNFQTQLQIKRVNKEWDSLDAAYTRLENKSDTIKAVR